MKRVFIVAGDPSGDLIASQLVEAMKRREPSLHVDGLGGRHLERVSDRFLGNIVSQHALGFAISPHQVRFFHRVLTNVIAPELKNNKWDAVIPVDFYGFNSRVAAIAKKAGHRVFYYASPQFWASRPGRAEKLRKSVDMFLCLFPFELEFYRRRQLPVQFVGHPLLDCLPELPIEKVPRVECVVGLLPGSRPAEIRRHLPVMAKACALVRKNHPGTRFLVFTVPHVSHDTYNELLEKCGNPCLLELIQDENYTWRSQLDMAITASGMETLENALMGIPMVVMYKTNWLTYFVARMLIRIPFLGMPNLLAGKKIVPEYIQWAATPENVAAPILEWIEKPGLRNQLRMELLALQKKFGDNGASDRAARVILENVA